MAIKFTAIKCPNCGADLSIEEGRKKMFCSFCGAQVIMTNENEHIYRHVDEAEILQAETDRLVRLKELELEESEENRGRKGRTIAFGVALCFVVVGAVSSAFGEYIGIGAIVIGAYIALFAFVSGDESKKRRQEAKMAREGKIKLTTAVCEYEKKDYRVVQSAFKALGFANVQVVNLKDLRMGFLKKPGLIENVTINGEEPECDEWYDSHSTIVITYHGFLE